VSETSLLFSDLILGQTVCELRYDMAFLIFDRTGAVCKECKSHYPDLKLIAASPATTSFTFGTQTYIIEQTTSRVICSTPHHDPKALAAEAAPFFDIVLSAFEIPVITRIGLRQTFFQVFPGRDDARHALQRLKFYDEPSDSHFGIKNPAQEITLRWESDDIGAMLHIGSLPDSVSMPVADLMQIAKKNKEERKIREEFTSLAFVDVDFYTVSSVLRSQWDAEEFIATNSHVIKKNIRSILNR